MKILVIGDLHGRKPKIHFKDFDCMVQVGDVCDDSKLNKYGKLWFQLVKKHGNDAPSSDELMLSDLGEKGIKKLEKESLLEGRKILKFLVSFLKPVFFVPGNWDQSWGEVNEENFDKSGYFYYKEWYKMFLYSKINKFLNLKHKNFHNCQYRNHKLNGFNFLGYGLSNAPEKIIQKPKKNLTKEEKRKVNMISDKILQKLSNAYKKRNKKFPTIFISHNIPYNTKLDMVKDRKSYAYKKHLGSWIARKFCEKYQPLICVGGHIHEGKGKNKIGRTLVINPGFGKNAQVLIDIDEKKRKVRKVKFYGKR